MWWCEPTVCACCCIAHVCGHFYFTDSLALELKGDKNVVKQIVCVAERLSITAQCKISFTQLLNKKLDLVHVLNTFWYCTLARLQRVVVLLLFSYRAPVTSVCLQTSLLLTKPRISSVQVIYLYKKNFTDTSCLSLNVKT